QFIRRELMSGEGGFYSALDADSEGVEGKFYTWQKAEIDSILGDDAAIFNEFYNVSEQGNWEHTNILRIRQPLNEFASARDLDPLVLGLQLGKCRKLLLAERSKRIRPLLDDKILLSWNALMNIALSKAYAATLNKDYLDLAVDNMRFL